jgi:lysozyme
MEHAMNVDKVRQLIERHEGRRNVSYKDSLGFPTIGIGHLLSRPISDAAVNQIFEDDLKDHAADLFKSLPWAKDLDEARQGALIDMAFNLGINGLLGFKNTLAAMQAGNWEAAALGLEQSKWYGQVKTRGPRIVAMFRTGKWPV